MPACVSHEHCVELSVREGSRGDALVCQCVAKPKNANDHTSTNANTPAGAAAGAKTGKT